MRSRMLLQFCCRIDNLREGEGAKLSLMGKSDFCPSPHHAAEKAAAWRGETRRRRHHDRRPEECSLVT
jgi:hypothetical protein